MENTQTKGNKKAKKRQRSENWLEEDKHLLTDLVSERADLIENKNTDTNTNTKKASAWVDVLSSFNSMSKGGPRTVAQLKSQWGILKMMEKKKLLKERRETDKTGGGPPPKTDPESEDDIASWLPEEFDVPSNISDSDEYDKPTTSAESIIVNEIKCRRELHQAQVENERELHDAKMENEKRLGRNLDLEYMLIKKKLLNLEKDHK